MTYDDKLSKSLSTHGLHIINLHSTTRRRNLKWSEITTTEGFSFIPTLDTSQFTYHVCNDNVKVMQKGREACQASAIVA